MGITTDERKRQRILKQKRARAFERYHSDPVHKTAKQDAARERSVEVLASETKADRRVRLARMAAYSATHREKINARRRRVRAQSA